MNKLFLIILSAVLIALPVTGMAAYEGGDVKDGSAWFVIISQLDEKAAIANGKPAPPAAASNSKKNEEPKPTNTASAKTTNTASK